jgi:hypothetical protein
MMWVDDHPTNGRRYLDDFWKPTALKLKLKECVTDAGDPDTFLPLVSPNQTVAVNSTSGGFNFLSPEDLQNPSNLVLTSIAVLHDD